MRVRGAQPEAAPFILVARVVSTTRNTFGQSAKATLSEVGCTDELGKTTFASATLVHNYQGSAIVDGRLTRRVIACDSRHRSYGIGVSNLSGTIEKKPASGRNRSHGKTL
jgi:hypothetical protein